MTQAQRGSRMANAPQEAAATQAASRSQGQEAKRMTELQGLLPPDSSAVGCCLHKAVLACSVVLCSVPSISLHVPSPGLVRHCATLVTLSMHEASNNTELVKQDTQGQDTGRNRKSCAVHYYGRNLSFKSQLTTSQAVAPARCLCSMAHMCIPACTFAAPTGQPHITIPARLTKRNDRFVAVQVPVGGSCACPLIFCFLLRAAVLPPNLLLLLGAAVLRP